MLSRRGVCGWGGAGGDDTQVRGAVGRSLLR